MNHGPVALISQHPFCLESFLLVSHEQENERNCDAIPSLDLILLIYNHLISMVMSECDPKPSVFWFWISGCRDKQWFNVTQWYLRGLYICLMVSNCHCLVHSTSNGQVFCDMLPCDPFFVFCFILASARVLVWSRDRISASGCKWSLEQLGASIQLGWDSDCSVLGNTAQTMVCSFSRGVWIVPLISEFFPWAFRFVQQQFSLVWPSAVFGVVRNCAEP